MPNREILWDPEWFGELDDPPYGDRRSDIMRDCLESLSEEEQFLAYGRVYEQLSYRELADRMGLSHEAVRKRWANIQAKLKRKYERATSKVTLEHPEYGITVEVRKDDFDIIDGYIKDGWRITWE